MFKFFGWVEFCGSLSFFCRVFCVYFDGICFAVLLGVGGE